MKFKMHVIDDRSIEPWEEAEDRSLKAEGYPETEEGAREWARDCVEIFNSTLRPGERPRRLVRVEVVGEGTTRHVWVKVSAATEMGLSHPYDRMACERCGVTGKRFGLDASNIKRDSKFRAQKYATCHPHEETDG